VPYTFLDQAADIAVLVTGTQLPHLFADASAAFTDSITVLDRVEPKRPEEVDLDAPELDLVLVDFLTELLYRFDTRGWLTRHAELELHEKDGGFDRRFDRVPGTVQPFAAQRALQRPKG
jgi:SHS2 domain-containing protein